MRNGYERMRVSNSHSAKKIAVRTLFELAEGGFYIPPPTEIHLYQVQPVQQYIMRFSQTKLSTNAHKFMTNMSILVRESLATATYQV